MISKEMQWAGHVARMGRGEKCMQDRGGEALQYLGVNEGVMLKWILEN